MRNILLVTIMFVFLSGCSAPRYTVKSISPLDKNIEVVIINDKETRPGFQETMESWLHSHDYIYSVSPDGSKHELDKLTLEYVGRWSWDFALFLADANINAYHKGQRVGEANYRAPNNFNSNKWGNGAERIGYMMDALFGDITINEANNMVNPPVDTENQDTLD
jgi:hypothetical protein